MPFNKAFRARSNSLASKRPIEPLHFTRDSSTTGRLTSKVCIIPSQSSLEVVLLDFELEAETAVCVDKSIFGEVSDCVELWFNILYQSNHMCTPSWSLFIYLKSGASFWYAELYHSCLGLNLEVWSSCSGWSTWILYFLISGFHYIFKLFGFLREWF